MTIEMSGSSPLGPPLGRKRSLFPAVVAIATFFESFFLGPVGFDVLADTMVMTMCFRLAGYERTGMRPNRQRITCPVGRIRG